MPLRRTARRRALSRFGELEIVTPLARGGMGGVYLAEDVETGERVALKVLDPQFANYPEVVARLDSECALASRVKHPGLLDIRAARRSIDDVPYLVMEYLRGETLAAIADRGALEQPLAIALCAQVASALAALHEAGVVHCDVKPENVFVLEDTIDGWPRVKVIDFGVSRALDELPDEATVAGTPWCMAPEQWRGRPVPASDVYALGCMLYDLITGHPPFDGSLPELMLAHLEQRPARPSWLVQLPGALERLILHALAKEPELRPTMAQVAHELVLLADGCAPDQLRAVG